MEMYNNRKIIYFLVPKILGKKTKINIFVILYLPRRLMSTTTEELIIQEKNNVGLITLNRPKVKVLVVQ